MAHTITLRHEATVTTAISVLQASPVADRAVKLIRAWATQRGSTTNAQAHIGIRRKSAGATVTAAIDGTHIFEHDPAGPTPSNFFTLSTSATGVIATAEGTDTDLMYSEGFSVLTGFRYLPIPEERIDVEGGDFIALQFLTAPASQNWIFGMTFLVP
jgi:hypothetical protein